VEQDALLAGMYWVEDAGVAQALQAFEQVLRA
jgi:hypothetical protein